MRFTCVAIGRKRLFQKSKWQTREKGYFKFGGSTVMLVAKAGAITFDSDLVANSSAGLETRVLCGERIGI